MEKPLWPGWKAALVWFVGIFVVICVVGGIYAGVSDVEPELAGRRAGQTLAPVLFLVPGVVYIIQKSRLDSARARAGREAHLAQRRGQPPR